MTQDEQWMIKYKEVVSFIETNHRNPSRHRIEDHDYLNWLKANRKALNAGTLKPKRVEPFKLLLELIEKNKRLNQYVQVREAKKVVLPVKAARPLWDAGGSNG